MNKLDTEKIIEAGESAIEHGINQGFIKSAAQSKSVVQILTDDEGNMYQLCVILEPYKESNMTPYPGND